MKKERLAWMICIVLTVGCGRFPGDVQPGSTETIKDTINTVKVGFSQMENNSPWRIAETNSVKNEARDRGVNLIYADAGGSDEQQVEDIQYLIEMGVDYLIIAPRKYDGLGDSLQKTKEAGVPVILIDRSVVGTAGDDYVTLISSDKVSQGRQAAEMLEKATGGEARIVELKGTEGASSTTDRLAGFRSALEAYPGMEIIRSQDADYTRAGGKKVMEGIIRDHGKSFNSIYAHNDEMALGAIMALKAAGIEPGKDVKVVSIDGERDALKAIVAGELYATIECTPFLGPVTFNVIEKHMAGTKIDKWIINKDQVFTLENALQMMDAAY